MHDAGGGRILGSSSLLFGNAASEQLQTQELKMFVEGKLEMFHLTCWKHACLLFPILASSRLVQKYSGIDTANSIRSTKSFFPRSTRPSDGNPLFFHPKLSLQKPSPLLLHVPTMVRAQTTAGTQHDRSPEENVVLFCKTQCDWEHVEMWNLAVSARIFGQNNQR